ncbi:MAG: DUF1549 and DUF1553 domain-containing protein, partial [Verrucomicrobiota bacterium]|nr:DUF1549 and DUF1553 domain-containing protein [Verrucomicrobiota bacterium]
YNRLLQTTAEGGAQAKEYEAIYFADRVRNFSIVWLASTIGCAQCHDHKFDPFTMRDFYSLASFFGEVQQKGVMTPEPGMLVPSPEQEQRKTELDAKLAALQKTLDTATPELAAAQTEWEKTFDPASFPAWRPLAIGSATSTNQAVLQPQPDGSLLAQGEARPNDEYTIIGTTDLQKITGFRIELLPDSSLPKNGPGRGAGGTLVVNDFGASVRTGARGKPVKIELEEPTASFAVVEPGNPVRLWQAATLEKKGKKFRFPVKAAQAGREHHLVVATKQPLTVTPDTTLTLIIRHDAADGVRSSGRFRISAIPEGKPRASIGFAPEDIANLLAQEPARRAPGHVKALAAHFRGVAPQLDPVRRELATTRTQYDRSVAEIPKTLVTATEPPKVLKIKARGNWMDESGEPVSPAVPKSFPALRSAATESPSRLDLARWVVAPENPLTARVFVNRLWKLYFGQGLAMTLEDLGSQGEAPSHPELLDWLAVEFRESGWDVKHLVRLMVSSATYQQTSVASPELRERDPYNQLLARQGRFRFDAELVRDNALAVSGLLVGKLGGTSTRPYQPDGYWAYLNFPTRPYEQDHGERLYRRSVYMWWQRTFLHPTLLAFDASTREECVAERARSNTPQQALVLMNDPIYVEAARVFAERIVREGGADAAARVRWAFARALSRPPDAEEADALLKLYRSQLGHYQQATDAARQLASVGEWPVASGIELAEVAAWSAVSRAVLNLHETITRN